MPQFHNKRSVPSGYTKVPTRHDTNGRRRESPEYESIEERAPPHFSLRSKRTHPKSTGRNQSRSQKLRKEKYMAEQPTFKRHQDKMTAEQRTAYEHVDTRPRP